MRLNAAAAYNLPSRIRARGTGLISSGSSEWRSRSPAVESMASHMPPMKRRQDQEIRQHREQQRAARLRRGLITRRDRQAGVYRGASPRAISRIAPVRRE